MTPWTDRAREERALLNPAFCAQLLWHAARGHASATPNGLSFEESFLVLPFVLHAPTRSALPRDTRTSMVVWLARNPLARGNIVDRARLLVPFVREALTFGAMHGVIELSQGRVQPRAEWAGRVSAVLAEANDDVSDCARRAEFVGKWFARAGSSATVLALVGVRP